MNLTDLQSVTVTNHTNLIPKIFWVLILVYMELYSRSFRSVITAGWYTAYLTPCWSGVQPCKHHTSRPFAQDININKSLRSVASFSSTALTRMPVFAILTLLLVRLCNILTNTFFFLIAAFAILKLLSFILRCRFEFDLSFSPMNLCKQIININNVLEIIYSKNNWVGIFSVICHLLNSRQILLQYNI